MPVEFEWEINVESSNSRDYRIFIEKLRSQLSVRYSHNRPVLTLQEQYPPTRFFILVLRTNIHSVRFRFRVDNLYLIGYQMENGQWLEFGTSGAHLIEEPGTTFLGFGGDYNRLSNVAHLDMEQIRIGYHNLRDGINQLATSTDWAVRAHYLIVVIMMICESSRFIHILDHVAPTFDDATDGSLQISPWIANLARAWGDFSAALLHADTDPNPPPPDDRGHPQYIIRANDVRIPPDTTVQIRSIRQVAELLGILLGLCITRRSGRPRRMTLDNEGKCFQGLPLVQVFSVHIDYVIKKEIWQLYGTITVDDGLNIEYLYNRANTNRETVKPDQNVSLTGPSQSILAINNFTIKLLLTQEYPWSWNAIDLINEDISWDASTGHIVYDSPIPRQLVSSTGAVTVNYAVFRNAAAAKITIILENLKGFPKTNVYGKVDACYGNWKKDHNTTSMLFNRSYFDDFIDVRHRCEIPLSRSVVAVPLEASLIVEACLYNYDTKSGHEEEIVKGTLEFPAEMSGNRVQQIEANHGILAIVRVDWTCQI